MSDTIRKQILDAMISKLAEIRTSNGYQTEIGKYIHTYRVAQRSTPCVSMWPEQETIEQVYGADAHTMVVRVEGIVDFIKMQGYESHEVNNILHERILGDIIENIAGEKWTLDFTSGGTRKPVAGDLVEGQSSGAVAYVESYNLSTGTFAGGDAAGSLVLRKKVGTFESENLDIGGESNQATTDGTITHTSAEESTCNDLVEDILLRLAGRESYPEADEAVIGSSASFDIVYHTIKGNPFAQPS